MTPTAIVIIVLASLAMGGFSQWMKFKEKAIQLGSATDELNDVFTKVSKQLKSLESENSNLKRRVEVLEAIVTEENFDEMMEKRAAAKKEGVKQLENKPQIELPDVDEVLEGRNNPRRRSRS